MTTMATPPPPTPTGSGSRATQKSLLKECQAALCHQTASRQSTLVTTTADRQLTQQEKRWRLRKVLYDPIDGVLAELEPDTALYDPETVGVAAGAKDTWRRVADALAAVDILLGIGKCCDCRKPCWDPAHNVVAASRRCSCAAQKCLICKCCVGEHASLRYTVQGPGGMSGGKAVAAPFADGDGPETVLFAGRRSNSSGRSSSGGGGGGGGGEASALHGPAPAATCQMRLCRCPLPSLYYHWVKWLKRCTTPVVYDETDEPQRWEDPVERPAGSGVAANQAWQLEKAERRKRVARFNKACRWQWHLSCRAAIVHLVDSGGGPLAAGRARAAAAADDAPGSGGSSGDPPDGGGPRPRPRPGPGPAHDARLLWDYGMARLSGWTRGKELHLGREAEKKKERERKDADDRHKMWVIRKNRRRIRLPAEPADTTVRWNVPSYLPATAPDDAARWEPADCLVGKPAGGKKGPGIAGTGHLPGGVHPPSKSRPPQSSVDLIRRSGTGTVIFAKSKKQGHTSAASAASPASPASPSSFSADGQPLPPSRRAGSTMYVHAHNDEDQEACLRQLEQEGYVYRGNYADEASYRSALAAAAAQLEFRHAMQPAARQTEVDGRFKNWMGFKSIFEEARRVLGAFPPLPLWPDVVAVGAAAAGPDENFGLQDRAKASVWLAVGGALRSIDAVHTGLFVPWRSWARDFADGVACRRAWDGFPPVACDLHRPSSPSSALVQRFLRRGTCGRGGCDYPQVLRALLEKRRADEYGDECEKRECMNSEGRGTGWTMSAQCAQCKQEGPLSVAEFTAFLTQVGFVANDGEISTLVHIFRAGDDVGTGNGGSGGNGSGRGSRSANGNVASHVDWRQIIGAVAVAGGGGRGLGGVRGTRSSSRLRCSWLAACHLCGMPDAHELVPRLGYDGITRQSKRSHEKRGVDMASRGRGAAAASAVAAAAASAAVRRSRDNGKVAAVKETGKVCGHPNWMSTWHRRLHDLEQQEQNGAAPPGRCQAAEWGLEQALSALSFLKTLLNQLEAGGSWPNAVPRSLQDANEQAAPPVEPVIRALRGYDDPDAARCTELYLRWCPGSQDAGRGASDGRDRSALFYVLEEFVPVPHRERGLRGGALGGAFREILRDPPQATTAEGRSMPFAFKYDARGLRPGSQHIFRLTAYNRAGATPVVGCFSTLPRRPRQPKMGGANFGWPSAKRGRPTADVYVTWSNKGGVTAHSLARLGSQCPRSHQVGAWGGVAAAAVAATHHSHHDHDNSVHAHAEDHGADHHAHAHHAEVAVRAQLRQRKARLEMEDLSLREHLLMVMDSGDTTSDEGGDSEDDEDMMGGGAAAQQTKAETKHEGKSGGPTHKEGKSGGPSHTAVVAEVGMTGKKGKRSPSGGGVDEGDDLIPREAIGRIFDILVALDAVAGAGNAVRQSCLTNAAKDDPRFVALVSQIPGLGVILDESMYSRSLNAMSVQQAGWLSLDEFTVFCDALASAGAQKRRRAAKNKRVASANAACTCSLRLDCRWRGEHEHRNAEEINVEAGGEYVFASDIAEEVKELDTTAHHGVHSTEGGEFAHLVPRTRVAGREGEIFELFAEQVGTAEAIAAAEEASEEAMMGGTAAAAPPGGAEGYRPVYRGKHQGCKVIDLVPSCTYNLCVRSYNAAHEETCVGPVVTYTVPLPLPAQPPVAVAVQSFSVTLRCSVGDIFHLLTWRARSERKHRDFAEDLAGGHGRGGGVAGWQDVLDDWGAMGGAGAGAGAVGGQGNMPSSHPSGVKGRPLERLLLRMQARPSGQASSSSSSSRGVWEEAGTCPIQDGDSAPHSTAGGGGDGSVQIIQGEVLVAVDGLTAASSYEIRYCLQLVRQKSARQERADASAPGGASWSVVASSRWSAAAAVRTAVGPLSAPRVIHVGAGHAIVAWRPISGRSATGSGHGDGNGEDGMGFEVQFRPVEPEEDGVSADPLPEQNPGAAGAGGGHHWNHVNNAVYCQIFGDDANHPGGAHKCPRLLPPTKWNLRPEYHAVATRGMGGGAAAGGGGEEQPPLGLRGAFDPAGISAEATVVLGKETERGTEQTTGAEGRGGEHTWIRAIGVISRGQHGQYVQRVDGLRASQRYRFRVVAFGNAVDAAVAAEGGAEDVAVSWEVASAERRLRTPTAKEAKHEHTVLRWHLSQGGTRNYSPSSTPTPFVVPVTLAVPSGGEHAGGRDASLSDVALGDIVCYTERIAWAGVGETEETPRAAAAKGVAGAAGADTHKEGKSGGPTHREGKSGGPTHKEAPPPSPSPSPPGSVARLVAARVVRDESSAPVRRGAHRAQRVGTAVDRRRMLGLEVLFCDTKDKRVVLRRGAKLARTIEELLWDRAAGTPRVVVRGRWKDERGRVAVLGGGARQRGGDSGQYDDDDFDEEHPFDDEDDDGRGGRGAGGGVVGMAGMSLDDAAAAVSNAQVEPPYPTRKGDMAVLGQNNG